VLLDGGNQRLSFFSWTTDPRALFSLLSVELRPCRHLLARMVTEIACRLWEIELNVPSSSVDVGTETYTRFT
jgi:hypothetical protein